MNWDLSSLGHKTRKHIASVVANSFLKTMREARLVIKPVWKEGRDHII